MNIYKILDIPFIYNLSQLILAPGKRFFMNKIWGKAFDTSRTPVLDVGCGPSLIGPRPTGELYGVDIRTRYLSAYLDESLPINAKNINQKTIVKEGSSTCLPFEDNFFQEVRANGFLHHINDNDLLLSAKEMYRCLAIGGQLIILEDVWPKSFLRRPFAWLIRKYDQGKFMRSEEELVRLFRDVIDEPVCIERHTYTFIGTELLYMKWIK